MIISEIPTKWKEKFFLSDTSEKCYLLFPTSSNKEPLNPSIDDLSSSNGTSSNDRLPNPSQPNSTNDQSPNPSIDDLSSSNGPSSNDRIPNPSQPNSINDQSPNPSRENSTNSINDQSPNPSQPNSTNSIINQSSNLSSTTKSNEILSNLSPSKTYPSNETIQTLEDLVDNYPLFKPSR